MLFALIGEKLDTRLGAQDIAQLARDEIAGLVRRMSLLLAKRHPFDILDQVAVQRILVFQLRCALFARRRRILGFFLCHENLLVVVIPMLAFSQPNIKMWVIFAKRKPGALQAAHPAFHLAGAQALAILKYLTFCNWLRYS